MHLTGGPLKAQQEQNRQYLLRLDPDRLLSRFRSEAGLKPKAPPYGGWESSKVKSVDLAEHILAFWMAGAAATVEATGDEELKRRLLYVIDELAAVQDAHGCGYALATENGRKAMAQIAEGALPVDALRRPADYLEPTAVGPLTFRLKDTEVLLVPMFALHYSRYAMY